MTSFNQSDFLNSGHNILTRSVSSDLPGWDGVDGENEAVVVEAHVEAGKHSGQTEGRELFLGNPPPSPWLGFEDVGADDVGLPIYQNMLQVWALTILSLWSLTS